MRSPTATALLAALTVLGLTSCTAGDAPGQSAAGGAGTPSSGEASPPLEEEAVTDAPRPAVTDVVLSYAVWEQGTQALEAAGYVSPVVEDGGTCTLELTGAERTFSVTGPATADATTTVCTGVSVPGDELAAGTWTLRLHYTSATTEGTSEPLTVEVPA